MRTMHNLNALSMYATIGAEIMEILWFCLLLEGFLVIQCFQNFLYYIFILLAHSKTTSNNGKKEDIQ